MLSFNSLERRRRLIVVFRDALGVDLVADISVVFKGAACRSFTLSMRHFDRLTSNTTKSIGIIDEKTAHACRRARCVASYSS
jgi:hypothetical protein